jgi:hypothetical protein
VTDLRIIVEGTNKAGKTTFVEELLKTFKDYETFHFVDFEREQNNFFGLITKKNVVLDRSHISYLLYNFTERKKIDSELFWKAEDVCRKLNVLKVYLDASDEILKTRTSHHDNVSEVGRLYFYYYLFEHGPKLYFDTGKLSVMDEVEIISEVEGNYENAR